MDMCENIRNILQKCESYKTDLITQMQNTGMDNKTHLISILLWFLDQQAILHRRPVLFTAASCDTDERSNYVTGSRNLPTGPPTH